MTNLINAVDAAVEMLIDVRGNTTTLEVKKYLRKQNWKVTQQQVSDVMSKMLGLTFTDNGTYRTYEFATPPDLKTPVKKKKKTPSKPKVKKASRSKMVKLMKNAGGRFITVTFKKIDGSTRVMNCQVDTQDFMNTLGYINVKKNGGKGSKYRQVNPRTLLGLKVDGVNYALK